MQATCSSCQNVVTVDENNPKLPEGPFSVKCPKCQTPVRFPGRPKKAAPQKAVPNGTMTTAISTKMMASRSVMRWNGDVMNRRTPAAVSTVFTASNASHCSA